ncbi:MAG: FlgD immunoglobulin-like domain containing protein [bacterium]
MEHIRNLYGSILFSALFMFCVLLISNEVVAQELDLIVTEISAPSFASTQQQVEVSWLVSNQGSGDAIPCNKRCGWWGCELQGFDSLYLSADDKLDDSDTPLGSCCRLEELPAGGSCTGSVQFTVPEVPAGSYYLIVITDRDNYIYFAYEGVYKPGKMIFEARRELINFYLEIPIDPNDKIGPPGFDLEGTPDNQLKRFVTINSQMRYNVLFENLETATAATQEFLITDQLDSNLDWSTFTCGWNLVGYKGEDGKSRIEAISGIYQHCISVFAYNTQANTWQYYINSGGSYIVRDLESMYQRKGYWMNMSSNCVWDPNSQPQGAPIDYVFSGQITPRPELPHIVYGNVDVDGVKVSKTSEYIPSIILKVDGKILSTYRMLSKEGYGGYYVFDVPVTDNTSKIELYVELDGDISKVGELPIEIPGKVTRYDISYRRIPKESRLLQNYPNPFNPDTWIPYQLKEASEVEIRIYESTGRIVRTLNLGYKEPGYYESRERAAYWDGRNEYGERVASGVYFYNIKAGKFTSTRKMVILR